MLLFGAVHLAADRCDTQLGSGRWPDGSFLAHPCTHTPGQEQALMKDRFPAARCDLDAESMTIRQQIRCCGELESFEQMPIVPTSSVRPRMPVPSEWPRQDSALRVRSRPVGASQGVRPEGDREDHRG